MSDTRLAARILATVDDLMTTEEVSDYLRIPVPTLWQWRSRGLGPRAAKVGRHLRYRRRDVDAWLDRQSEGHGDGPEAA